MIKAGYRGKGFKLDQIKKELIELSIKHLHGPEKIKLSKEDVIVLCLVKDGEQYIEEFIEHYFKLGVKHIVFLDNMSSDRTLDIARKYDNVTVLQTGHPFRNNNDMRMREFLIEKYGKNKWSLTVDIDEFFDYPYSDIIKLKDLIRYLNINDYTAVVTQMLDLFPENILRFKKRKFDLKNHKYYEISNIIKNNYFFEECDFKKTDIKIYIGGIRKTIFCFEPWLTKHALLFYD
ncbi:hypothetical protein GF386_05580 [Candidatus Pacearchaeota archaeon]|nr:hypothetical protein [Candidatus Pacearchaeota archaeon]